MPAYISGMTLLHIFTQRLVTSKLAEVTSIPVSQKIIDHEDRERTAIVCVYGPDPKEIHVTSAHISVDEIPSQDYISTSVESG